MHEKKKLSALIFFSVIVAILIVEGLLRFMGWGFHYSQERQNRESNVSKESPLDQTGDIQLNVVKGKEFTILCIGESTTGIGGINSWPRQLQRILNNIQDVTTFRVVNKGVPGITTTGLSAKLPEFLSSYDPDLVLAMVGINDHPGEDPSFDSEGLLSFEPSLGEAPPSESRWRDLLSRFRIYGLIEWISDGITARVSKNNGGMPTAKLLGKGGDTKGNSVVYNLINPNASQLHPQTIRNLNNMVELTTDQGISFVFVQYALRKTDILRNVIERDIFYISNYEIFLNLLQKHEYSDVFYDKFGGNFGHATTFGNRIIADNVARQLIKFMESEK